MPISNNETSIVFSVLNNDNAFDEKKIKVAGQPKIDLKSYGEGKDLNYTLEIDELPSIKLKPIDNIKFTDFFCLQFENLRKFTGVY